MRAAGGRGPEARVGEIVTVVFVLVVALLWLAVGLGGMVSAG